MTTDPISIHVGAVDAAGSGRPMAGLGGVPASIDAVDRDLAAGLAGGGLAQRMQARLAKIQADNRRDFPVPGYNGALVATFHTLSDEQWQRVAGHADDVTNAELIALATERIVVEDGGERMEFVSWAGDFAELMGLPADTDPTIVVSAVLGGNVVRVGAFTQSVLGWMTDGVIAGQDELGE